MLYQKRKREEKDAKKDAKEGKSKEMSRKELKDIQRLKKGR